MIFQLTEYAALHKLVGIAELPRSNSPLTGFQVFVIGALSQAIKKCQLPNFRDLFSEGQLFNLFWKASSSLTEFGKGKRATILLGIGASISAFQGVPDDLRS